MRWNIYAIPHPNDVAFEYWYGDYNYCDYTVYFGKPHVSVVMLDFLAKIYELRIMIISSSSIFLHEYMSIWYVHVNVNSDSMWINDIRSLHLEAIIRSLPMKAVKLIQCGSLHLEAVAHWVLPCEGS